MQNETRNGYTYICKYCGKVYETPVRECESCGSTEFSNVSDGNRRKKTISKKVKIVIAAVAVVALLVAGTIASFGIIEELLFSMEDMKYITEEYDYDASLTEKDEMFLGRKYSSYDVNYYRSIKINGSFEDLYANVFGSIYSRQLADFRFSVPCNAEAKDGELSVDITAMEFNYYSSSGYVRFSMSAAGSTDKEISLYLVDGDGNKDKLLMDKYTKDKYSSVADYLLSDEYSKEFSVAAEAVEYKKLLVDIGGAAQEFELDYGRAKGYIEYYALNVGQ